ncbi:hypothetical protein HMPREF2753_03295 [Neisseria sp. HMSC071C03]|nr:hypothetical protein HMPREF3054_01840 [Neisseria sp. HMSC071B12]OHR48550.1 hypothetical protein HMPREF2753_03295 [Neisseria sp. HMSC071C03]
MTEQVQNQETLINEFDKKSNLEDWERKYDFVITALSQEYYSQIETIRQADEKTNKYLVVVSIFIAGFFTILASSLMDNLTFQTNPLTLKSSLSIILVILLVVAGFYSIKTIKFLLDSLDFVPRWKLPDLSQDLDRFDTNNSTEFKNHLIQCYQEAINKTKTSIDEKQGKIRSAAKHVHISSVLMVYITALLFVIKYLN